MRTLLALLALGVICQRRGAQRGGRGGSAGAACPGTPTALFAAMINQKQREASD